MRAASFVPLLAAGAAAGSGTVTIAAGVDMPMVMLGTGYMKGYIGMNVSSTAEMNVQKWLALGGRGVGTANNYHDQEGIATAVGASGVARKDIFILSKIPGTNGADATVSKVNEDLAQLRTEYIDVLLLHYCGGTSSQTFGSGKCTSANIQSSWQALEDLQAQGKVRAIGISNFCSAELKALLAIAKVKPALHQIERHPGYPQTEMVAQCAAAGITVQEYGPIGDADRCAAGKSLLQDSTVSSIAKAHSLSPAQVLQRWSTQRGIPVSTRVQNGNEDWMKENLAVMGEGFATLTDAEMGELDGMSASKKCWPVGVC